MPKNVKLTLDLVIDGEHAAGETLAAIFDALDAVPFVLNAKAIKLSPTTPAEDAIAASTKKRRVAKCYACDRPSVGTRDRRHHAEGEIVAACARHADTPKALRAEDIR